MNFFKNTWNKNRSFLQDNFVLFGTTMLLHILGFLFHFYASRKLGPAEYGLFGSLLSLLYIITVPLNTIQTAISIFVSRFKVSGEHGKINFLLRHSLKKLFIYSIVSIIVFL